MSAQEKPTCRAVRAWLRARHGRDCLGVFTGGTNRAFSAYLHLVEAWVCDRSPAVEAALRALVPVLQRTEHMLAADAIAAVGDWCHVQELWDRIRPAGARRYRSTPEGCHLIVDGTIYPEACL